MFDPAYYKQMYSRILGARSEPVSALINTGSSYTSYESVPAFVTQYRETDLLPDSSVQVGDLRIVILQDDIDSFSLPRMGKKDRINIDGRTYAVVHWDTFTRAIAGVTIAVDIAVRGGGLAIVATAFVYRITGSGDNRITGDGDRRGIREAI